MSEALKEIEKLALDAAKKAQQEDTPIQSKIDALRALAPYYSLLKKRSGQDGSEDEGSLESLAASIADAERDDGGSTEIANGLHSRNRTRSQI